MTPVITGKQGTADASPLVFCMSLTSTKVKKSICHKSGNRLGFST